MQTSDFRFFHPLRVRWVEVDMQKIVFNGHYLMYFDTAVGDYWRHLVLPYEQTMHDLGGDLYVVKSTLEYLSAASRLVMLALRVVMVPPSSPNFLSHSVAGGVGLALRLIGIFSERFRVYEVPCGLALIAGNLDAPFVFAQAKADGGVMAFHIGVVRDFFNGIRHPRRNGFAEPINPLFGGA